MTESGLPYNHSLADLESLLSRVQRPGDFCMHAALALPMPVVQVDGVGSLSFPLLEAQAAALIAAAERAPYGRGEHAVLDTSVRRVWQIDAARVRLGGKHWAQSLKRVLADAARGLGCGDAAIQAELYKLLVYDPGGFFLPHRDTEKAPGTLAEAAPAILAAQAFDKWLGALIEAAFLRCPRALCELLFLLEEANLTQTRPDHGLALRRFADALVGALPGLATRPPRREFDEGPLQSPQTLVCRKTRASYRRQCQQHAEDVAAMRALQAMGEGALSAECAQLDAAAARQPQAAEG